MNKRLLAFSLAAISICSCLFGSCGNSIKDKEGETMEEVTTEAETEDVFSKTYTEIKRTKDLAYLNSQQYRPYYHFSCEEHGMNDPNGLFYDSVTGIYHAYFQYNPKSVFVAQNCVWGHAVSGDLVNWIELEPALLSKNKLGIVASGSCVIDEDNTSGFFDDSIVPERRIVAIYSNFNKQTQIQSVAYSLDGGYSFEFYENNPVLTESPTGEVDFRDPKVFKFYDEKYENGYIWVMIVAGGTHALYTSPNLKDWTFNSIIMNPFAEGGPAPIVSECPDMFQLPIDGDENNMKWVLSHSGSFYMIGELGFNEEGMLEFTGETPLKRLTTPNTAALQTFYNTPDNRRIALSWQADFSAGYDREHFPDKVWNGCHTVAEEITLVTNDNGEIILKMNPVDELQLLRGEKIFNLVETTVNQDSENLIKDVHSTHFDLVCTIDVSKAKNVGIKIRVGEGEEIDISYSTSSGCLRVDTSLSGSLMLPYETKYNEPMSVRKDGTIKIRVLGDGMALEVFGNDGENVVENIIFPKDDSDGFDIYANGEAVIKSLDIYEMKSIFKNAGE